MLITNANLVTWAEDSQLLEDQAVYISDGLIQAIGPSTELKDQYPEAQAMDAGGQLLMPGNICAHTHFYGTFARGMAIPGRAPADFPAILRKLWWPLDESLGEQDVRLSALVSLVDAIRHGTTTLIDHHASPNAIEGSLDVLAEAVAEAGMRAVLCYEVTDRGGQARTEAGIRENLRFLERCRSEPVAEGRVSAAFGLHASLTLSDATLERCRAAAPEGTPFHIHVAEHEADQYDSLERSGMRVVERLDSHGILSPNSILAHAVHVSPAEIATLANRPVFVSHQPRSNMNNGVGVADVEGMLAAGVRVCLGNDGFSNAMWEEWKAAYLVHKVWHRDPRRLPADRVAEMAITNNALLAEAFFPGGTFRSLEPGAHADLILVDYDPPTPLTSANLAWHVIFGFNPSMVTATLVSGQVLMWGREIKGLDEVEIMRQARQLAGELWGRYPSRVPRDSGLPLSGNEGRR